MKHIVVVMTLGVFISAHFGQGERVYKYVVLERVHVPGGEVVTQVTSDHFSRYSDLGQDAITVKIDPKDSAEMYQLITRSDFFNLEDGLRYTCMYDESGGVITSTLRVFIEEGGEKMDKILNFDCGCIYTNAPDSVCNILDKVTEFYYKYNSK